MPHMHVMLRVTLMVRPADTPCCCRKLKSFFFRDACLCKSGQRTERWGTEANTQTGDRTSR